MRSTGSVLPIDGAVRLSASAGGKALGLAEIAGAGLSMPAAWAVLPGTANVDLTALAESLAARGISRVAVRSSAADEDGGQHSFAGIHETELGVPVERLREAIARVAASPLSDRARAYRRQHGLPAAASPCAVVVQELVEAEWAGVAFGKGGGVLVEAVEGLGEVAVNGDATPEQLELVRTGERFRVTRRWPRKQPFAVRVTATGTERVELTGTAPALPEAVALEVAAGVAALEEAKGKPLDVEWAVRAGKVAFLQARPQTRPLEDYLPPGEVWSRANLSETYPEIPSAHARCYTVALLNRSFRGMFARFRVPLDERIPMAAAVAGRLVFNERAAYGWGDLLGIPRSWVYLVMGGPAQGTNAYVQPSLRKLLARPGLILRMNLFARGAEGVTRAFILELQGLIAREPATRDFDFSNPELLNDFRSRWEAEADEAMVHILRVVSVFNQGLSSAAMVLRRHPAPAALIARLLDPELTSVSTRQLEEQVEIARAMHGWEGGRRFLAEVGPAHAGRAHWQRTLPGNLWARIERWLEAYGHRGPYESDEAQPRYSDDLRLLATALRPLVEGAEEPEPLDVRRARRRADCDAAWREVATWVGPLGRLLLRRWVRTLGRVMHLREELRSTLVKRGAQRRVESLELGRRLVAMGRLGQADEVFTLSADQQDRALCDPAFDAPAAVAREGARIAAWRRMEVPDTFRSEDVADFGRRGATTASAETTLRGTAVSPGVVEARACVLRAPDDEAKLAPGGILVTHTTDPGWTPLFARAAGVVVEIGGVMSHAATVAREYGLPCVSNMDGAVAKLRDGDLLRVDGTHGTVEILERAAR